MWVFASMWVSRPLCGPWTSLTLSPLPNEPLPSLVHHLWASTCQPCTSFILHGNLASHRCLAPLAIILISWTFSKIVCVAFMGLLGIIYRPRPNYKRDSSALLHLRKGFKYTPCSRSKCGRNLVNLASFIPHTIVGFVTTFCRDKHLREVP